VEPIVNIVGQNADHVPPGGVAVNVVVVPTAIDVVPPMDGVGSTETRNVAMPTPGAK